VSYCNRFGVELLDEKWVDMYCKSCFYYLDGRCTYFRDFSKAKSLQEVIDDGLR